MNVPQQIRAIPVDDLEAMLHDYQAVWLAERLVRQIHSGHTVASAARQCRVSVHIARRIVAQWAREKL